MTATAASQTANAATRLVDGVEAPVAGTYEVDASHTDVGFVVRHLMLSKTRGRFPGVTGTIVIGEDPLDSRVEVSIETAGVDTGDENRDQHLRSADFFDTEQHPVMTYRSRAVRPAGPGRWTVDGDLTIRDVTRPVVLDLSFEGGLTDPWGNVRAGFTASAQLDRDEFGLTWNQLLEGGGVLVSRTVSIEIEAELVRAA
jgi:polyisoprenoid-binding protein YceI